ncbi:hypothetical protein [Paraburkholderia sp. J8-2]|uniref:hypothetical protein n=1 Tax=Paraburkholderia sp. J8-2 TaxID=2805440 RepID=UPI002AB60D53|nr:hypothetical protein [Paraburkholderia sp. J8-2]
MKKILLVALLGFSAAAHAQMGAQAVGTHATTNTHDALIQAGAGAALDSDCGSNGAFALNRDGSGEVLKCERKKWVPLHGSNETVSTVTALHAGQHIDEPRCHAPAGAAIEAKPEARSANETVTASLIPDGDGWRLDLDRLDSSGRKLDASAATATVKIACAL